VARAILNLNPYCRALFSNLDEKDDGTFSVSPVKDKEIKIHLLLRSVYRHVHNCEKQLVASSCLFICPHGTTQLLLDKFS
jgi:hypothetical protein